jgi:2-desacetyl-2-hydroxyethyl bacteriochlorophyllide A dehydrogenase
MRERAVVAPEKGKVVLQEINVPNPGRQEVQVRVHASIISPGTERAFILNLPNTPGQYPFEPGYSAAGVIEKKGAAVTEFDEGDRVACFLVPHRSLANVGQELVVKISPQVTFEEAAFMSLGQIALQGVRKARIELGEEVLVFGLGLIGLLSVKLAKLSGAMHVAGADLNENRLKAALKHGADAAIDSSQAGWLDKLAVRPHVVIESTGYPDAVGIALMAARPLGRVILLGSTRGDSLVNFYRDVHRPGLTIIGAHAVLTLPKFESRPGFWTWREEAQCFISFLSNERINVLDLITDRIHPDKVQETYQRIVAWNPDILGCVIQWV